MSAEFLQSPMCRTLVQRLAIGYFLMPVIVSPTDKLSLLINVFLWGENAQIYASLPSVQ